MNHKLYKISEVIEEMNFGQIAIMIEGQNAKPYKTVGTAVYFDKNDNGALKFLHSGNDVVICKDDSSEKESNWIIVDR